MIKGYRDLTCRRFKKMTSGQVAVRRCSDIFGTFLKTQTTPKLLRQLYIPQYPHPKSFLHCPHHYHHHLSTCIVGCCGRLLPFCDSFHTLPYILHPASGYIFYICLSHRFIFWVLFFPIGPNSRDRSSFCDILFLNHKNYDVDLEWFDQSKRWSSCLTITFLWLMRCFLSVPVKNRHGGDLK